MFTLLYFSFTCLCVYTETNIWLWYVLCMHMYFVELICYPSHHRCNNPKNASQYWHDLSQDLTPPQSKHTLGEVRHLVVKSLFFGRMVFLAKVESTTVCTWDSPGPGHKGFPARWSINFAFVAYPEVRGMLIRNQTVQFRNSSASVWILQALGFNDSQLGANN